MLRNFLRYTLPCLAVIALVIALNERWPLIGKTVTALVVALTIVGSAVKLWRVRQGDFGFTSRDLWMPKRWRDWSIPKK